MVDTELRGADPETVRRALETGDPLPGTAGFAGVVDNVLVRDVLGRVPLYVESAATGGEPVPLTAECWAFSPTELDAPVALPAGSAWRLAAHTDTETDLDTDTDTDTEGKTDTPWSLPTPNPDTDHDRALERVTDAITDATAAIDTDGLAVAFSGGVDSALVAALLEVPLYVAGFPGSHDIEAAESAAAAMGAKLTVIELEPADLERAVPEIVRATGRTNAMDVQIALPLYLTAKRVVADGFNRLAVGQGADELFGGYEKVARLDHRVEAETVRGAVREQMLTLPDQLPRDVLTLEAAGVEPVAPLLDDRVVLAALRLPDALLVADSRRKVGFRQVAAEYLPPEIAAREKKAVQYGSLVARELDRLARQAGYKRRMDDHVDKYIESLVA